MSTMEVLQSELKISKRNIPVRDISFLKSKSSANPVEEKPSGDKSYVLGTWPATMPGHTGYLTVATLPPTFIRKKAKISENNLQGGVEEKEETTLGDSMSVDGEVQ